MPETMVELECGVERCIDCGSSFVIRKIKNGVVYVSCMGDENHKRILYLRDTPHEPEEKEKEYSLEEYYEKPEYPYCMECDQSTPDNLPNDSETCKNCPANEPLLSPSQDTKGKACPACKGDVNPILYYCDACQVELGAEKVIDTPTVSEPVEDIYIRSTRGGISIMVNGIGLNLGNILEKSRDILKSGSRIPEMVDGVRLWERLEPEGEE